MIATGGGTFRPGTDRHCFFLAAAPHEAHRRYHLTAVNDALTDGEAATSIEGPIDRGARLFLDSGVFNLTNSHATAMGMSMEQALSTPPDQIRGFAELFDRYVTLVRRYGERLWGYIELDQGGRDHKRRTRARLHDLGLSPVPVYHPLNDGWDYFDELAEQYDRICVGNLVRARPRARVRLLHTIWERRRRYPHLWIHVLGLTVSEQVAALPADSCDSSSWCSGLRWSDKNLASSYLARGQAVGTLAAGFLYNRDIGRFETGGWMHAARTYAETYDLVTDLWRQVAADRADLGQAPWPAGFAAEPPPAPAHRLDTT